MMKVARKKTTRRSTPNAFDRVLRAVRHEALPVSSQEAGTGRIWLGLLHDDDVWCRVGIQVEEDRLAVTLRAWSSNEALGYIRWRFADVVDDTVDVGPQLDDTYGLHYCDMHRTFDGAFELVDWVRTLLDTALDSGLVFSARHGFDFSPDSCDMAWHFQAATA